MAKTVQLVPTFTKQEVPIPNSPATYETLNPELFTVNSTGLVTMTEPTVGGSGHIRVRSALDPNIYTDVPGTVLPIPTPGDDLPVPLAGDRVLFDARAGGANDLQAATNYAQMAAAFNVDSLCEMINSPRFVSDFNGTGTNAMGSQYVGEGTNCVDRNGGKILKYFPGNNPKHVFIRYKMHMGRTIQDTAGLGDVGAFSIYNANCGNAGRKVFLLPRDVQDMGGYGRINFLFAGPAAPPPQFTMDDPNFLVSASAPDPNTLIGKDVLVVVELKAASTDEAEDGIARMWMYYDGQSHQYLNRADLKLLDLGFNRWEIPSTFRAPLIDQTEYFWDMVVWEPAEDPTPEPDLLIDPADFANDAAWRAVINSSLSTYDNPSQAGTGDGSSLFSDGRCVDLIDLDNTVLFNGEKTFRLNFPPSTDVTGILRTYSIGATDRVWIRRYIKYKPGFTTIGIGSGGAAGYKVGPFTNFESVPGYPVTTYGRTGPEFTNTNQYVMVGCPQDNACLSAPPASYGNNETTAWDDEKWYVHITRFEKISSDSFVSQHWIQEYGSPEPPQLITDLTSTMIEEYDMPGFYGISLFGENYNRVRTAGQNLDMYFGPIGLWTTDPDPFNLLDQLPIGSVTVEPTSASILVAATQKFTGTVRNTNEEPMPEEPVTYSSSNTSIATVNSTTGVATGVAAGTCDIIATSVTDSLISGSGSLTVTTPLPDPAFVELTSVINGSRWGINWTDPGITNGTQARNAVLALDSLAALPPAAQWSIVENDPTFDKVVEITASNFGDWTTRLMSDASLVNNCRIRFVLKLINCVPSDFTTNGRRAAQLAHYNQSESVRWEGTSGGTDAMYLLPTGMGFTMPTQYVNNAAALLTSGDWIELIMEFRDTGNSTFTALIAMNTWDTTRNITAQSTSNPADYPGPNEIQLDVFRMFEPFFGGAGKVVRIGAVESLNPLDANGDYIPLASIGT